MHEYVRVHCTNWNESELIFLLAFCSAQWGRGGDIWGKKAGDKKKQTQFQSSNYLQMPTILLSSKTSIGFTHLTSAFLKCDVHSKTYSEVKTLFS